MAKYGNGRDVSKPAIIDVKSIVSGRNYYLFIIYYYYLASIITQWLTSQPFPNLCHTFHNAILNLCYIVIFCYYILLFCYILKEITEFISNT